MPDPTIIEVTGTIEPVTVTGEITETVAVSVNINEFGYYAGPKIYKDFSELPDHQMTDFPDLPLDSAIVLHEVTSEYFDPNTYGNWET